MDEIIPSGVSTPTASSESTSSAGSPPAQSVPESNSSGNVTTTPPSQDTATATPETDPLAGIPSIEEVQGDTVSKEAFVRLRGAYDQVAPQFKDLQTKYGVFEPYQDRFESAEQFAKVIELQDSLIGWENDAETGMPIPSTQAGAQQLQTSYPQHADYLAADLLQMDTRDPDTGRIVPRIDLVLESIAADKDRRARALSILGGVDPGSMAPQWQPTEDELANVKPELQDVYRKLSYEEREELKLNSPEFINRTLQREQMTQELQREREIRQAGERENAHNQEQQLNQKAIEAGNNYIDTQLKSALTTFHNAVVEQCNFIEPLDPANLPQGISPEQATAMNAQIAEANQAEAAQITIQVMGLLNPQLRAFAEPLLKQAGLVDDKFLKELDDAAAAFAANGRNYGNLQYRGQLQANGNGYQPGADVTNLNNAATRSLQKLIFLGNSLKGKLMERRSGFFSLKAGNHNQSLNASQAVRPSINGSTYDPTTAAAQKQPSGWQTRRELDAQYG